MSRVLITGIAGLFGANFSRYLIAKGYNVIGIDNLSGGYLENIPSGVDFYNIDLLDTHSISNIFKNTRPDYVYHFAAYAAVGLSHFIRNFNYQNNVIASVNLINECLRHNIEKIIFTSSMDVYGSGNPPYFESHVPKPEDPYGIAKLAIEQDLAAAHSQFGLRYSIIRPHNVFGLYQNIWDKYRNVIGIWIRQILEGMPITIYGDGTQVRSFSDIQFCMTPLSHLMSEFDGEIFNIGADQHITINELSDTLRGAAEGLGYSASTIHMEKRKEVHTAFCDHSKAKGYLEFEDKTNLTDLMTRMLKWARIQPKREVKMLNYEIDSGMYAYWRNE